MTSVYEVEAFLAQKAPKERKLDFDNVGLLAGRGEAQVTKILTALDITLEVIGEARRLGAELIVSHHPLFFGLKTVTSGDDAGRRVLALLEGHMAAICMHTNLDAAEGGVNDALMEALGGTADGVLDPETGIGRVGRLEQSLSMDAFLAQVKKALGANGLRYHDAGRPVQRLGCCGGSGGGELALALQAGCDTYVTADVKYDQFLLAKAMGINLIDADHFCIENVVVPRLAAWLTEAFPQVETVVSRLHSQTAQFY